MANADMTNLTAARRAAPSRGAISIIVLGQALSAFLIVSYLLRILGWFIWPNGPVQHASLGIFLPGFTLLSWHTFFLGLFESFVWGWYIAVVFGLLYNIFARRTG